MESAYTTCGHELEGPEKECKEGPSCATEVKQQEIEASASPGKTECVPATASEEAQVPDKAQMSSRSLSSCAEALQKLLLQHPANSMKRLVVNPPTVAETIRCTETTVTRTLSSTAPAGAAQAGAAPETMLAATSDTCAQGDALNPAQREEVVYAGEWTASSNLVVRLLAQRHAEMCQKKYIEREDSRERESRNNEVNKEVARFTPKPHIVDLPLDLIYTVPKVTTRMVKYTIEVPIPGISRLVPKAFPVDTPFIVPQISDVDVPVVMSQTFIPELEECSKVIEIPVARYVPKLVPVDVYVPRPVAIPIKTGELKQYSKPAQVSEDLLHQLSVEMNPHLVALNQYNTQQAAKFSNVVKRSVELANALGVPPPVPERIEIDPLHQKSQCTEVIDEHGFKELVLNLNGRELESVDATFHKVKKAADTSRKPVVQVTPVSEDYILSVIDAGKTRHFRGIPSGYATSGLLPLSAQEPAGHPSRQPLGNSGIVEASESQTVLSSPQPEEGNTTVAPPGIASPLSDETAA